MLRFTLLILCRNKNVYICLLFLAQLLLMLVLPLHSLFLHIFLFIYSLFLTVFSPTHFHPSHPFSFLPVFLIFTRIQFPLLLFFHSLSLSLFPIPSYSIHFSPFYSCMLSMPSTFVPFISSQVDFSPYNPPLKCSATSYSLPSTAHTTCMGVSTCRLFH